MDGILNVYKEKGYTSHDVVARLRGILKQKKIGHTGTLDPDAEGVLPVCLGKATKVCELLTDKEKTYETVLLLGVETDTQDMTGTELQKKDTGHLSEEQVRSVINDFQGVYHQIPPMYSALKIEGKRLYELARQGMEVERKSRPVHIYEIKIIEICMPRIKMSITCSKGTYIRTLCHDIGRKLGCGGCMEQLIRTKVDRFEVETSMRLEEIEKLQKDGSLSAHTIPTGAMFADYPKVKVEEPLHPIIYNGNPIAKELLADFFDAGQLDKIRIYDSFDHFIAIYQYQTETESFRPVKMFLEGV